MKKTILLCTLLVLALSATAAFADGGTQRTTVITPELGPVDAITDGRLNGLDLGALVAVYYTTVSQQAVDAQGRPETYADGSPVRVDTITGVELWGQVAPAVFDKVVSASLADLRAAIAAGVDTTVAAGQGYTLGYAASGYLWVSAPPDASGNIYTFAWVLPQDL